VDAFLVGFGLGFLVALQLGPMSLFLVRSTLRRRWAVRLAIGALVDALYAAAGAAGAAPLPAIGPPRVVLMLAGAVVLVVSAGIGSLVWVTALASVVAVVRRAAGDRALRTADAIAGAGLLGFGGALAYGAPRSDG
jgi:arginine exporter protein ArgO